MTQTCFQGILQHIPKTTQQVTLIFNDLTFKTILKKITLPFIFMIKPYRIRRQNPMNIKTQATGFYDKMNVNIGTAESLILGLARGDLDWREQLKAD